MKNYKIVCKETGSVIETFATYDEAQSYRRFLRHNLKLKKKKTKPAKNARKFE